MSSELSAWERHLLSERQLRERYWELRLRLGVCALLGTGCAGGLAAGWWGVNLSELARELLWVGTVGGLAGAFSAWREWRYVALLRKVMRRLSVLEVGEVNTAVADEGFPEGTSRPQS